MTNRKNPPSDELMTKVVAKWKGWKQGTNAMACRYGFIYRGQDSTARYLPVDDPRTDTDAALELLGWLHGSHDVDVQMDIIWEVAICRDDPECGMGGYNYSHIPLSGQPFRTAICWLAVDVLGVE